MRADRRLPRGDVTLRLEFDYDGGNPGSGGTARLLVDGEKIAEGRIDRTVPYAFSADESLDIGTDLASPVTEAFTDGDSRFAGEIRGVTIDIGKEPPMKPEHLATKIADEMTPSTVPSNAGVLTAGVGWTDEGCELYADETHPDVVLAVADFENALGLALVAAAVGDWVIESSDSSTTPTTYITGFGYTEDVSMVLENAGVRLEVTLQVNPGTLVLIELRPI